MAMPGSPLQPMLLSAEALRCTVPPRAETHCAMYVNRDGEWRMLRRMGESKPGAPFMGTLAEVEEECAAQEIAVWQPLRIPEFRP